MQGYDGDPEKFVKENRETLLRIIEHGDDEFVRAIALNALVLYGDEPSLEDIRRELQRAEGNSDR